MTRAHDKYALARPAVEWLDTARVARRTWEQCAWSGYGLANVCEIIGHEFRHHDALEDAKACAQVLLAVMRESGLDIYSIRSRVNRPIVDDGTGKNIRRAGNPDGILFGEIMCFTGALAISRRDAAELASNLGCDVLPGVTKRTTILIVGDQDIGKLNGKDKSAKHLKAEALMRDGQEMRILCESDFLEMAAIAARS